MLDGFLGSIDSAGYGMPRSSRPPSLRFSPGPGGPADRQLRSAREARLSIVLANRRITYSLEACCSEDQSYCTLLSCEQTHLRKSARLGVLSHSLTRVVLLEVVDLHA